MNERLVIISIIVSATVPPAAVAEEADAASEMEQTEIVGPGAADEAISDRAVDQETQEGEAEEVTGSSEEEQVDPCTGVTCSGHGTCRVILSSAFCFCDGGYRLDPRSPDLETRLLNCIPASAVPIPQQQVQDSELQGQDRELPSRYLGPNSLRRRRLGVALLAVGLFFTIPAVGFMLVGPFIDFGEAAIMAGGAGLGVGLPFLIPGAIIRHRANRNYYDHESSPSSH